MRKFESDELKDLFKPAENSSGEDNGQVTIIGGSELFHGAPLLSVRAASRIVDMVFFASPEPAMGEIAAYLKASLSAFIWVPWEDVEEYVAKSDAILIGPGFMRYHSEKTDHSVRYEECDEACRRSRDTTERFLKKFPEKRWVIDAGSLQTMDPAWIPPEAILTPNRKEYSYLFGDVDPHKIAQKHNCTIVIKGQVTVVCLPNDCIEVHGGNPGLTKGGTGDVQAGLTVALLAKNEPFLAAAAASYIIKAAADELHKHVGTTYNADDLANTIPETYAKHTR